jgi:hypothetical protein
MRASSGNEVDSAAYDFHRTASFGSQGSQISGPRFSILCAVWVYRNHLHYFATWVHDLPELIVTQLPLQPLRRQLHAGHDHAENRQNHRANTMFQFP